MKNAEDLLKAHIERHHLKATRARGVILRAMMEAKEHLTAEELHARMKDKMASVSLATVYRTLNLLCECGLTESHQFGDGHTRYELIHNVHHHDHLVCVRCHKIIEFENLLIERLQDKVARKHGFTIYRHKLELYGLCLECAKTEEKTKRG